MRKSDLIASVVSIRRMSYGQIKLVYCTYYTGTHYIIPKSGAQFHIIAERYIIIIVSNVFLVSYRRNVSGSTFFTNLTFYFTTWSAYTE